MSKILLIEDNNEIRESVSEILLLAGYDVSEARNGKQGVNGNKRFARPYFVRHHNART